MSWCEAANATNATSASEVWNMSDNRSLYLSGSLGPFLRRSPEKVRMPEGVATPYRRRPEGERKLSVSVKKTQEAAQRATKAPVRMRFRRRGEDGEGEDGGGREENVEARRAAEDEVEEHDEARAVVLLVIVFVLAWWIVGGGVLAGLLD
nr:unnamed protein product [Digitaria exilis]